MFADQQIPLMVEGVDGLTRLGAIADSLMLRTWGCSGCTLSPHSLPHVWMRPIRSARLGKPPRAAHGPTASRLDRVTSLASTSRASGSR